MLEARGAKIEVAAIDCAVAGNMETVCSQFAIKGYPAMYYGEPEMFRSDSVSWPPAEVKLKGRPSAAGVVAWIEERDVGAVPAVHPGGAGGAGAGGDVALTFVDNDGARLAGDAPLSPPIVSSTGGVALAVRRATEASIASAMGALSGEAVGGSGEARLSLARFAALLADVHPLRECRAGAAALSHRLAALWPDGGRADAAALAAFPMCGQGESAVAVPDAEDGEWGACAGSVPGARGYTCGLWLLFHSLASRVPPDGGGMLWASAVGGYVEHFFGCEQCAEHFRGMAERRQLGRVRTRRDAVLWAWRAHNEVNARLRDEERFDGTGDPAHPKVQWPSEGECGDCRGGSGADGWRITRVYAFLQRTYGDGGAGDAGGGMSRGAAAAAAIGITGAAGVALLCARSHGVGHKPRRATGALMANSRTRRGI